MYSLQELIEHGIVDSITTESYPVGDAYKITVKLSRYSIGRITIDVGIDEYLDDAVTLINGIVDIQENLNKATKPKEKAPVKHLNPEEAEEFFKTKVVKDANNSEE